MKWLKQLGILLIFIVIVTFALSMILPTHQEVKRTITINAPAKEVYEKLSRLEDFNKIAVWAGRDSSVVYTLKGEDGQLGSSYSWKGDPEISGEGKITIHSLDPNKTVKHSLQFTSPKKREAESIFTLDESNNATTVTWEFTLSTPRPWNIFNLLHSIDQEMGADFEEGLATLKNSLERSSTASTSTPASEVQLLNFPAKTMAIVRERVKWDDLSFFYAANHELILKNKGDSIFTAATSLVYERDEELRQSDVAAAIEVPAGTKLEHNIIRIVDIPASKAVYIDYDGAWINTNELYPIIRKYLADNDLKQTGPIIEQELPTNSTQPGWSIGKIRVIFLVE